MMFVVSKVGAALGTEPFTDGVYANSSWLVAELN